MCVLFVQSRTYADARNYAASLECLAACAKRLKALVQSSSAASDAVSFGLTQVLCDDAAQALADKSTETTQQPIHPARSSVRRHADFLSRPC